MLCGEVAGLLPVLDGVVGGETVARLRALVAPVPGAEPAPAPGQGRDGAAATEAGRAVAAAGAEEVRSMTLVASVPPQGIPPSSRQAPMPAARDLGATRVVRRTRTASVSDDSLEDGADDVNDKRTPQGGEEGAQALRDLQVRRCTRAASDLERGLTPAQTAHPTHGTL